MGQVAKPSASSSATAPRDPRRADIQALRAVAALLVVVFHLWPGTLTGGYIGVDVFFVISGFLITSHLLRDADRAGRIDLPRFWARRARRLLPSALVVLAFTAVVTWWWVPEGFHEQFFRGIAASALYVENWNLASEAVDYLAEDNAASPTQHYWTLSVEEQFYIVWPLLVVLGLWLSRRWRRPHRVAVGAVLTVVTFASLAYSIWLTETDPAAAFFVTPTRAWEFGAGALLAFVVPLAQDRMNAGLGAAVAWLGLAVVLACGWVFDAQTAMPGIAAMVVVAGACLFLLGGAPAPRSWSPDRVLDVRPVQFTGDISYALYLWHWPLIILIPYVQGHPNGQRTLWAIFALTFVLAAFSTYVIENPIRFSRRRWIRGTAPSLVTWLTTAAVLAAACFAVVQVQQERTRQDIEIAENFREKTPRCAGAASIDPEKPCENPRLDRILVPSVEAVSSDRARIEGQRCASRDPDEPIVPCFGGDWDDPDLPKVVIVGDSHARMMTTPLQLLADQGVLAWKGYFQSGCILTSDDDTTTAYPAECASFKERLPQVVAPDLQQADFAITTGRVSNLTGTPQEQVDGLADAWGLFAEYDVPVVALSDVPEVGDIVGCLSERSRDRMDECDRRASDVLTEPDPLLLAADAVPDAESIDMHPYYCTDEVCPAVTGGVIVYMNSNHLSATYAATLAPILRRELARLDLLEPAG